GLGGLGPSCLGGGSGIAPAESVQLGPVAQRIEGACVAAADGPQPDQSDADHGVHGAPFPGEAGAPRGATRSRPAGPVRRAERDVNSSNLRPPHLTCKRLQARLGPAVTVVVAPGCYRTG